MEKDAAGAVIDYAVATSGGLQIVPGGTGREALARDYDAMVTDGLMVRNALGFDELMQACEVLQDRVNAGGGEIK